MRTKEEVQVYSHASCVSRKSLNEKVTARTY